MADKTRILQDKHQRKGELYLPLNPVKFTLNWFNPMHEFPWKITISAGFPPNVLVDFHHFPIMYQRKSTTPRYTVGHTYTPRANGVGTAPMGRDSGGVAEASGRRKRR